MNLRLVPVVAVIVSLAGCGGTTTPASPTTPAVALSPAGNWSGTINDPISGEGTAQLSLSDQVSNTLTGNWSATFRNGDRVSGPAFAGQDGPNGYGIMLIVDPQARCAAPGGPTLLGFTLINVVVTASRLTAVAGRTACNGFSFGSVELSKR